MRANTEIQLSIIIAVYQRQDELTELLHSLTKQTIQDFEVVVVDDGSPEPLESVVDAFKEQLHLQYYYKSNSGPGLSRNYGMSKAQGNYFVFLDSDTIVPEHYIQEVKSELVQNYVDFYGGSDRAHHLFDHLQKAINFSMTSILTTGGVRGGKKRVDRFQPRSFNMGISNEAFELTDGFSKMRIGEDPDLSMTLWENGMKSRWFPNAFVFHKRRTSLAKFFQQVKGFGIARPILNQRHPQYKAITFWFPSLFLLGLVFSLVLFILNIPLFLSFYAAYFLAILLVSSYQNKSIIVGLLSVVTTLLQFVGYGFGFLWSQFQLNILGRQPEKAFPQHFYQ